MGGYRIWFGGSGQEGYKWGVISGVYSKGRVGLEKDRKPQAELKCAKNE